MIRERFISTKDQRIPIMLGMKWTTQKRKEKEEENEY